MPRERFQLQKQRRIASTDQKSIECSAGRHICLAHLPWATRRARVVIRSKKLKDMVADPAAWKNVVDDHKTVEIDTRPIGPLRSTRTDVTAGRANFEATVDALWESLTAAQKDEYVGSSFEAALAVSKNHITEVQRNAATPVNNNVQLPPTAPDAPSTSDTHSPQLDDDTFHLTAMGVVPGCAGHEMRNPRRTRRRHPTVQKVTQPATLHSSPHPQSVAQSQQALRFTPRRRSVGDGNDGARCATTRARHCVSWPT